MEKKVNKLSFVVHDLITNKYESMFEDATLLNYLDKTFHIYMDYYGRKDKYENMKDRIIFYSYSVHTFKPDILSAIWAEIKILSRATWICLTNQIDIVESHDPHILGINGFIISRLFGLPFILHLNTDYYWKWEKGGVKESPSFISRKQELMCEKFIIQSCDRVIADRDSYRITYEKLFGKDIFTKRG